MRRNRPEGPKLRPRRAAHAVLAALAVLAPAAAGPAAAQAGAPGTIVEHRPVAADTTLAYAIFLPPGHPGEAVRDTSRTWPALLLMDPRGRALLPLELFRPAAARLGYVILSSWDTSSDELDSADVTRRAAEGILNDAVDPLGLDPARLYLVGFSGTARMAWLMAIGAPQHFPAIVGFGAGFPEGLALLLLAERVEPPAFFGGAGTLDFNYAELWSAAATLQRIGVPHVLHHYPGPHAWPPEPVAAAAVEWLELRARRGDAAPADDAWLRDRLDSAVARARAEEEAGRGRDARDAYAAILDAFDGLPGLPTGSLDEARRAHARLERDPAVRDEDRRLGRWLAWEDSVRSRLAAVDRRFAATRIPSLSTLARELQLDDLHRQAADPDTLAAQAAGRRLAGIVVFASFYLPRQQLAAGDTARAVRALELAHLAAPQEPLVCRRVHRLLGSAAARSPRLRTACP